MTTQERNTQGARKFGSRTLVARCGCCDGEAIFSEHQVAAAKRVWAIGSGIDGVAAQDLLGGDGTTNQCGCGWECEVVFTGDQTCETQWRESRIATSA